MGALASITPGANMVPIALPSGKLDLTWLDFTSGAVAVVDANFSIVGSSDSSKTLRIEVDSQAAGADLTINTGAQPGDRTLSVPVLAGNSTLMVLEQAQTVTAALSVQATNGLTVTAASTQDAIRISGRAGGASSYIGTFVPAVLSASHTWTMPNVTGVVMTRPATALVATRLVLSDANGQLVDVAGSTTATLTAGGLTFSNPAGGAAMVVDGIAATERFVSFLTAGSRRWVIKGTADAESGSDAGTNFRITMHNDAGVATENVLTILRPAFGLTTLSRPLLLQIGTVTNAIQALESTVTWNSGGTTFTGWKLNVTNTASAAASLLCDLQVGGTARFQQRVDGAVAIGGVGSWGSGTGAVVFIANATANPSANPTGGGVLYAEAGALKWRGSSGTVTTIAAA